MSQIIGDLSIISNDEMEWRVPDFDVPEMNDHFCYYSSEFNISGKHWKLFIWPKWIGRSMCVALEKVLPGPLRTVQFSVALKAANGQKEYENSKIGVFNQGYTYYIDILLSREEYRRRKSELCISGSITIVCRIALLTAVDLCKKFNDLSEDFDDLSKEFDELRKEYEDSQLKLEETKKEKADIKEELDACKADKESISKEKLRLEDDLKAMRENLDGSPALVVPPKSKALQDLKQLFLNQENSDVVLRVKGMEFMAHKAILTARSPVFASTFRTEMKEKETGIVDIADCDPSSFSDFLCFLYCEELLDLSRENIFNLFTAADKYIITDLRTKCLDFMKGNLSVETFCETITVALQHTETELIRVCTDFFIENAEEIVETVKWQTFAAENSTESNELFIKYIKSAKRSHK